MSARAARKKQAPGGEDGGEGGLGGGTGVPVMEHRVMTGLGACV